MRINRKIVRPISLRQPGAALAIGLSAAMLGAPAMAQTSGPEQEVELDTLKIEGRTADVNPYAEEGAPYKAKVSGDARRTKPLAQTPTTITVVTEAAIKDAGVSDLKDILRLQPGVTVGTGENGNAFGDRYIIRGEEMRSDVFVDGLRDPGMTIRESFAVEQVELTKGPSSTFAGRGSAGGAVNSITKQATTEYNFINADGSVGTDEHVRLTADTNWKVSDKFALRVNGLYGYEEVPDRGPADRTRYGAAVSAVVKPADNFTALIDYYHLTAKDFPDLGTFIGTYNSAAGGYVRAAGGKPVADVPVYAQNGDFLKSDVDTITVRLKWEPTDGVRIENSARYGSADNSYVTTGLSGVVRSASDPVAPGMADMALDTGHQGWQKVEYLVDQLNLYGDFTLGGVKHQLIVGAELSDHKVRNGVYAISNTVARNCMTGTSTTYNSYCILNGVTDVPNVQGRVITKGTWDSDWEVKTKSLYVMDTIDVTKWLTLFGGARLDSFDYSNTAQNTTTLAKTRNDYSDTIWNFHGGVSVKPSDDGQFYFSFGTSSEINGGESDLGSSCGYGGICTFGTSGFGKPERITNVELGTKWELFDHKLMLTAAAFRFIKDDVFESASNEEGQGYDNFGTLNTGKHRVQGVEFGFVGNITSRLSGQASLTLMQSKILKSNVTANIGRKLSNFANNQANAQLRYQLTDAFAIGGAVNYKSSLAAGQPDTAAGYTTAINDYSYVVPGYVTFDALATYKFSDKLEARINVKNLTNKNYYLAAYRSGTFVYIGDARSARLTLSAKF